MPILGIIASQISGHLTPPDTGAMFPLGMVNVGSGGSSTIEFTSIPSTYKHLQIRGLIRNTRGFGRTDIYMQVGNSTIDTGSNYSWHRLYGNGSSVGADAGTSQTFINFATLNGGNSPANCFGGAVIDILDYANTNKYKTTRTLAGGDDNGVSQPPYISLMSGNWRSTSAINRIKFTCESDNFAEYSQFALYGIL